MLVMRGLVPAMTASSFNLSAPLSTIPEQRREPLLAVAGEIDDAAAGGSVARRPFQFGEPRHHRSTERAGEMMAPLAPIKTGLADRPARMAKAFSGYLQGFGQETLALGGQLDVLFPLPDQPLIFHAVEHLHAEIAGEMIVANPRAAQRRILWSRAHAHVTGTRRETCEAFEHAGDIGAGEAIIAVAALFLRFNQAAGFQLRQMRTRGLRRDAGLVCQLARGQGAAGHQRRQHVGTGGIADQCGDHGDIGACFHSSMITEASASIKRLYQGWFEPLEAPLAVTVFIRYQLDPFRRAMFEEYAKRWLTIIPRCGGDLVGYWMPHEGTNNIAFALISFENLAAYENYRARLQSDAEVMANVDFAEENKFILAEERTFLRKVTL